MEKREVKFELDQKTWDAIMELKETHSYKDKRHT